MIPWYVTIVPLATGTTISSLTSVRVSVRFPRWIVSVTRVPAVPLISAEPKLELRWANDVPPTAMIRSPRCSPPCAAGDPGNTSCTNSPFVSGRTSTPIPLRCGSSSFKNP